MPCVGTSSDSPSGDLDTDYADGTVARWMTDTDDDVFFAESSARDDGVHEHRFVVIESGSLRTRPVVLRQWWYLEVATAALQVVLIVDSLCSCPTTTTWYLVVLKLYGLRSLSITTRRSRLIFSGTSSVTRTDATNIR